MGKRTTRTLSLMLVLVMALSIFAVSYAATTKYAKSAVNVRSGPGTSYSIVGFLHTGDKVTILETKTVGGTKWGRIAKGWISMDYVKV